jgi:hypothetical protein
VVPCTHCTELQPFDGVTEVIPYTELKRGSALSFFGADLFLAGANCAYAESGNETYRSRALLWDNIEYQNTAVPMAELCTRYSHPLEYGPACQARTNASYKVGIVISSAAVGALNSLYDLVHTGTRVYWKLDTGIPHCVHPSVRKCILESLIAFIPQLGNVYWNPSLRSSLS